MNKIKDLRKSKGLTQSKLAEILNTTQANLSGWETGKWQPDNEALDLIANYFKVTVDYLLDRPILESPNSLIMTEKQKQLLQLLQQLDNDEMAKVIDYAALIKQARK